jgi:CDP-glucose 4,6-dehydratase
MDIRKGEMATMVISDDLWRGRNIMVTGHTGFKGAWLVMTLKRLGAVISGFALPAECEDGLFAACGVAGDLAHNIIGDVRDLSALESALETCKPDVIFHLAAQSLVRPSYDDPIGTLATNVIGTANVLQAARGVGVRALVMVTSDKCYENVGQIWGYRETDLMGGHDPYSGSKCASEIVIDSMRRSFFSGKGSGAVASARAGNVIGGGDWARDRLVPDVMRALIANESVILRKPSAVRPWQHVMDSVLGYILLAQNLLERGAEFAGGWNFGPGPHGEVPVLTLVKSLVGVWPSGGQWRIETFSDKHEAGFLALDCTKARRLLGWRPTIKLADAIRLTVEWYYDFASLGSLRTVTERQIEQVLGSLHSTQSSFFEGADCD